jgi:hypothetical protein
MRRLNSALSIVIAVAIGMVAVWLWTRKGTDASTTQSHAASHVAVPQLQGAPSRALSAPSPPSANTTNASSSPAAATPGRIPNDATYDRMLSVSQATPLRPGTHQELIERHERFLSAPDDPDWARTAEQQLWTFFQARAGSVLQITSVSCRSAGCEVQALMKPPCGGGPCEGPLPANVDPFAPIRVDWPAGLPLKREAIVEQFVGDEGGLYVTFTRDARASEGASSP